MSKLENRDYVVIIDKSGSMVATDTTSGQSRFKAAEESTVAIATMLEQYDPDGITVIPFSGSFKVYDNTTAAKVADIFKEHSPMGGTILTPPLQYCFDTYLKLKADGKAKENGMIVLVVTDGQPSDGEQVAKAITAFTHKLDNGDGEFGISFVQIGRDAEATAFLKRLDDDLTGAGAKFDIVDTKTIDEVEQIGLTETLIAALED
jgi:Mg-chelatase subunit ChlD